MEQYKYRRLVYPNSAYGLVARSLVLGLGSWQPVEKVNCWGGSCTATPGNAVKTGVAVMAAIYGEWMFWSATKTGEPNHDIGQSDVCRFVISPDDEYVAGAPDGGDGAAYVCSKKNGSATRLRHGAAKTNVVFITFSPDAKNKATDDGRTMKNMASIYGHIPATHYITIDTREKTGNLRSWQD